MKSRYYFPLTLLLALAVSTWLGAGQAWAQAGDTLLVEWETTPGSGEAIKNALRDAIINDTDRPADRVYLLRRGGFYWITDRITNNDFPLTIVGQEASQARPEDNVCGAGQDQDCGPAILQRVAREGGDAPDGVMFESFDDLTVKNVWIMGQTDLGTLATYEPIKLLGDGKRYVFDRVIFDRNDWHHLGPDGPNNDIIITNSEFRNLFGPTQIWEGLGIRLEVGADTVIFENNTFFNIGFTPFQSEAAPANYLRFNHNTLVNIGRSFQAGALWKEAYVTNNLFVNPFFQGESPAQYGDPERVDPYTGFFGIAQLPAQYGTNLERRIVLNNNLYWRDEAFDPIYEAGDYRAQPLVNDTTQGWFNRFEHMVMNNNILDVQPDLATYPLTDQMLDSIQVWLADLYADPVITPAPRWFWDPNREETCFVCSNWPVPEDFSYDNAALQTAGTDGLPLGDLNWFPTAKATFEANKEQYVSAIEDLAGGVVVVEPVGDIRQAEDGVLDGDATIEGVEGFTSYYMQGSGSIEWTFALDEAGTYGLVLYTQSQDAVRGEHVFVNGTELRNNEGFGEFYFSGLPADTWKAYPITTDSAAVAGAEALTMEAGENTVRITPSWGYQGFSGLDVVSAAGDTVAALKAPDAVASGVEERCAEDDYCPSAFASVAVGAGGSVAFNFDAPYDGMYLVRVFYAAGAPGDVQVSVNDEVVIPSLALEADTADVISGQFAMNTGVNTITFSSAGGGFSLDAVQLLGVGGTTTGVDRNELPDGYALDQNYPNPFNPTTTIAYTLGKPGTVRLSVFDILGRKVHTLVDQQQAAGTYRVTWDGRGVGGRVLASGVYFYRLETPVGRQVRSMVLMK